MSTVVPAATVLPWLWLTSRASGLILMVLFSAVVVLGVATRIGTAPRAWPRFVTAELHRTLALFAVALLALHVITAILDPFVSIGWWATILPFTSHYRTLALGLGALTVDLGAAVLITSLLRRRLGHRLWRAVHWLAYLAWPLAFAHALGAGGDLRIWWVAAVIWGSASAAVLAVGARIWTSVSVRQARRSPARLRSDLPNGPIGARSAR